MRKQSNDSLRALACAMLVLQMASTAPLHAQQSDPVLDWLMTDCAVGQEGQARAGLAELGANAVPALIGAIQNGPDATVIATRQASASLAYDSVQQALAAAGPSGLKVDPSDVAAGQAVTRDEFVTQDLSVFVGYYRLRGLQGLGVVGGGTAIQVLQQFASDSSSPDLQAVAKDALNGIFSAVSAKLEISGRTPPRIELNARFTLGASSDGISPLTEPVMVQVGTFFRIIPPGSFVVNKNGNFVFEGVIDVVKLEIEIRPLGNNSFAFRAEGSGVDLSALAFPVTVALTIGNDTGLTRISAEHD